MIGWLMALTGDKIELFKTKLGEEKEMSDGDEDGDGIEEEEEILDENGRAKEFFDENGITICQTSMESNLIVFSIIGIFTGVVPTNETLETLLTVSAGNKIPAEDIQGVVKFLKTCLRLTSWKRPIACDLMVDEWLKPASACSCGFSGY